MIKRALKIWVLAVALLIHPERPPAVSQQSCQFEKMRGAENYWRVAEDTNNVWWFISPSNKPEFLTTVTTIQPKETSRREGTPTFESSDFDGDLNKWAEVTASRVFSYGFKGSGAWSNEKIRPFMPYSHVLCVMTVLSEPITSPQWESAVDKYIKSQVSPLRENHNLVGYYLDNELKWDGDLAANATKYFKTICTAIRTYDPNHLILGVRFNRRPPLSVLRASRGFVDVHSIQVYDDNGRAWKNMFAEINEIADTPIVISEFSFLSNDNRSGDRNSNWLGYGRVPSQADRAKNYIYFVSGMATTSFMIGTDWFQWADEPPFGRADGEDGNFGIVDIKDQPYEKLVAACRFTNGLSNIIHSQSDSLQQQSVWMDDPKRD
jgi:hypothetical protein